MPNYIMHNETRRFVGPSIGWPIIQIQVLHGPLFKFWLARYLKEAFE